MRISSKIIALHGLVCALLISPAFAGLNIFACEPEYAALAKELAPDAEIFSATTALQDPHQIQARPSLIAKMRQADLAVCAGAELEIGWLPMLQMKSANPKVRSTEQGLFYAADQVELLDRLDSVDRSMGDVHGEGNPHLHLSPYRLELVAKALTSKLIELDTANSEQYQAALDDFSRRWQQAIPLWEKQANGLNGVNVIGYHASFRYLFDWLGIEQVGDLEPKPGIPPSTAHLASLIELAEHNDVTVIIHASYQDERGAQWLADRSGLPVLTLPMSVGGDEESVDLFTLYTSMIDKLTAVQQLEH